MTKVWRRQSTIFNIILGIIECIFIIINNNNNNDDENSTYEEQS